MRRRSASWITFSFATLAAVCIFGCGRPQAAQTRTYRLGERVEVGPLIYSVFHAEWRTQLGEGPELRTPKNRFLIVQLTITNSGGGETSIPPVTLEDGRGGSFPEEISGAGVTNWLGLLRKLRPAQTEQGRIVFDAPTGAYRLRVTDDNPELGQEKAALIDIPLRLDPEPAPQILKDLPSATPPAPR
ncbi:MAG: DUF4352 domain-containing protein [Bryobacterales bacterium]|nr:DUF4352 domain-containing protein [Bryobacterales bacterium]